MMEGGSAGGAGVVPAGWIGEATTSKSSPGETPYGYQWWIPSPGIYAALGIFGQTIYIDPAKDLVIVQIATWPAASGPHYSARRLALVGAVNESLGLTQPCPPPHIQGLTSARPRPHRQCPPHPDPT